jgi:adenine phosphoribosyltransferase
MRLEDYFRNVKDFPKPGVLFKDITPLLADYAATEECLDKLVALVGNQPIDIVVSIEARGFFFGILLAQRLKAGFVPIRKPGKLPYHTLSESYDLEYGTDTIEIHQDAIEEGDRILLHDDILATGGTALAACRLLERKGGDIVQINFLLEIEALRGVQKIGGYPVKSLFKF